MGRRGITTALITTPAVMPAHTEALTQVCQVTAPGFAGTPARGQLLTRVRCVAGPAVAAWLEEVPR